MAGDNFDLAKHKIIYVLCLIITF